MPLLGRTGRDGVRHALRKYPTLVGCRAKNICRERYGRREACFRVEENDWIAGALPVKKPGDSVRQGEGD